MCAAHPTAGSFGVYAGIYLSPFAGYAVRVTYWIMEIVATGGHLVAVSIYMQYWFPDVPGAFWSSASRLALLYLNARPVRSFAEFQYWFVMIKVVAVVVFVVLGAGRDLRLHRRACGRAADLAATRCPSASPACGWPAAS